MEEIAVTIIAVGTLSVLAVLLWQMIERRKSKRK